MTSYFSRLAPDLSRSKPSINLVIPGSTSSTSSSSTSRSPLPSPSRLLFGRQATSTTPIDPSDTDENRDLEDNKIKCSDCHAFMDVTQLGEHICSESPAPGLTTSSSTAEVMSPFSDSRLANGLKRQVPNGLRIDVTATKSSEPVVASTRGTTTATRVPLGSNGAVAQPALQSGYLSAEVNKLNLDASQPVTPNYLPHSPSATSVSSNSSNKLPFFEKYQRLNTPTASSSSTAGLSRSPNSDDLAARANSRWPVSPTTSSHLPTPGATEALYSFSSNGSSQSLASAGALSTGEGTGRASATRGPSPQPSVRSLQSNESRSSDDRSRLENSNFTTASSVLSSSPPRSRRIVVDERRIVPAEKSPLTPDHDDVFSAYDDHRRATLKASHSTPNGLTYYGQTNPGHALKPKPTPLKQSSLQSRATTELDSSAPSTPAISIGMTRSKGSSQTLDDCLEDLRLMTESDDEEEYDPLSSEYYDRRLTRSGPFDEDIELERTPKVSTPLPQSRSTPALSSSAALASIAGSGSMRAPYSNSHRNVSAASSASKPTAYPPRGSSSTTVKSCTTCRRDLSHDLKNVQKAGDGQVFCRGCYAERFLPKCRKCCRAIECGAVTSSDGKVLGKYHKDCFTCFTCSVPFPDGDFYVYDHKPYCQMHYHKLNGSLCANVRCGQPIEGPCVSLVGIENGGGGRYHVDHFVCSHRACGIALLEHHFVLSGLPYCERHAEVSPPRVPAAAGSSRSKPLASNDRSNPPLVSTTRAKKRQTIITRR